MTQSKITPQLPHFPRNFHKCFPQLLFASLLLAAAISSNFAHALSTNLVPVADTTLFEDSPNNNLGATDNFIAGTVAHGTRDRPLIKFDLTAIPADATITSAALTLTVVVAASGPDSIFALHRVLADWSEGSGSGMQGIMANNGETTWNNRFHPSTPWTSPGAAAGTDYAATFSATNVIGSSGSFTFASTTGLVANVQAWLNNPATNFGWILICQNESTLRTARRIASRENAVNTPVLTVEYTEASPPPPPPAPPTIFGLGQIENQVRFSFNAESNHTYAVEISTSLMPTNWTVLTNFPALPADSTIHFTNEISLGEHYFRVQTQ